MYLYWLARKQLRNSRYHCLYEAEEERKRHKQSQTKFLSCQINMQGLEGIRAQIYRK